MSSYKKFTMMVCLHVECLPYKLPETMRFRINFRFGLINTWTFRPENSTAPWFNALNNFVHERLIKNIKTAHGGGMSAGFNAQCANRDNIGFANESVCLPWPFLSCDCDLHHCPAHLLLVDFWPIDRSIGRKHML